MLSVAVMPMIVLIAGEVLIMGNEIIPTGQILLYSGGDGKEYITFFSRRSLLADAEGNGRAV